MTDKQPEALVWAGQLELLLPFMSPATFIAANKAIAELRRLHDYAQFMDEQIDKAETELRRLHELNQEMLMALYAVDAWLSTGEGTGFEAKVLAAIAKAEEK